MNINNDESFCNSKNVCCCILFILLNLCFVNISFAEEDCVNGAGDGIGKSYQQEIVSRHDPVERYKNTNNSEYITVEPGGNAGGVAADFAKLAHDKNINVLVAYKGTGCSAAAVRTPAKYDGSRNYIFTDHYYDSRYTGMECNYRRVRLIGNKDTADQYCKLLGYYRGAASYSTAGTWWASEPLRAMIYYDKAEGIWKSDILTSRCTRGGIDKNYYHLASIKCYGRNHECEKDSDCATGYKCEGYKCVKVTPKHECNDVVDNDSDGLVDLQDLGCKGYTPSSSGSGSTYNGSDDLVVLQNNEALIGTNSCKSYTMLEDGDVRITMRDDNAAVVVKRVEDQKTVILAKTDMAFFYAGCGFSSPINLTAANTRTAKYDSFYKINNDVVHYDRNGNETAYFPPDGADTVPAEAYSPATASLRTVSLKKGDVIYMPSRSDLRIEDRKPNLVELLGAAPKYEPAHSGEIVLQNDNPKQGINSCKEYSMPTDGDVLITMRDDNATVMVRRVEDQQIVILAKTDMAYFSAGCVVSTPMNLVQANARTAQYDTATKINNDVVHYDRYANETAYFAPDGSDRVPALAYAESTIPQRIVHLRKGDLLYMASRSDVRPEDRNPNTVEFVGKGGDEYKETHPYTYVDTDEQYGADDIYHQGTTTFYKGPGSVSFTDECANSNYLYEYRGVTDPKFVYSNGQIVPDDNRVQNLIYCEYGCENGACKYECEKDSDCDDGYQCVNHTCQPKPECTDAKDNDSDGLIDSNDPGCQNCSGNSCSEDQDYSCVDTDGNNSDSKGSTTYTKGNGSITTQDYCADPNTVVEQICVSNPIFGTDKKPLVGHGSVAVSCQYGCQNGACKPECTQDSDCQDGYECVNNTCQPKKECQDTYDNDGDGLKDASDLGCQNCSGAACKENQPYACSDTDGNNSDTKGSTTYTKGNASKTTYDYCSDGNTLVEQVCVSNPKFDSNKNPMIGYGATTVNCQYGCENGACKPECTKDSDCPDGYVCQNNTCNPDPAGKECRDTKDNDADGLTDANDFGCQNCYGDACKENQPYACSDTDGNNSDTKGSTTYTKGNTSKTTYDYCQDDNTLVEQVCVSNPKFDSNKNPLPGYGANRVNCEYGCANGACKPECTNDSDCKDGYVCKNNTCQPECIKDSDCQSGYTCENNRCVKGECQDKNDNDLDGLIDAMDLGCQNCSGNACKENQPYSCSDTDGEDDTQKGSATYTKGNTSLTVYDYCLTDNILIEEVCVAKPKFDNGKRPLEGYGAKRVECEYGCSNGACKPECTKNSDCEEGYYCSNNKCIKKNECEDSTDNDTDGLTDGSDLGCQNCKGSSCKETQPYSCQDSDGNNNASKGKTTYTKGNASLSAYDYCKNDNTLVEQVCVSNPKFDSSRMPLIGYGANEVACQYGCENGACKPECVKDSDCQDGYSCVNGSCVKDEEECQDSKDNDIDGLRDSADLGCQACVGSSCKENLPYTCQDSDGDNNTSKGKTTYTKGNASLSAYDYCKDDNTLVEQVCVSNPKFDSSRLPLIGYGAVEVSCEYGCENGACKTECTKDSDCQEGYSCVNGSCVKDEEECQDSKDNDTDGLTDSADLGCQACSGDACKENLPYSCQDSDGDNNTSKGKTTYTKGNASLSAYDYCKDDNTLVEQVCVSNPKFDSSKLPLIGYGATEVACEYGCENGACKPQCTKDSDCEEGYVCENNTCVPQKECKDTKDNDGDNLVDSQDPGCQACSGDSCKENQTYSCQDSDGDDDTQQGTVTYTKGNGSISVSDYCIDDTILVEEVCVANPRFDENKKPLNGSGAVRVTCEYGCSNGACKPQCEVDSDCASGQVCEDNKCVDSNVRIIPLVECVMDNGDNTLTAYFGYENNNDNKITIEPCDGTSQSKTCGKGNDLNNTVKVGSEIVTTQTSEFESGRNKGTFAVTFAKSKEAKWVLKSNSQDALSVVANTYTTKCAPVEPIANCISLNADSSIEAYFGYVNKNDFTVQIPVGIKNEVNPNPEDRGQPTSFYAGTVNNAFNTKLNTPSTSWFLNDTVATATKSTKTCYDINPPVCTKDGYTYVGQCQGDITNITLDGTSCTNPAGTTMTYKWTTDCEGGYIVDPTVINPTLSLTLPGKGENQNCHVSLTVSNGLQETTMTQNVEVPSCVVDCKGVPGGSAVVDICGVCDGDGTSCLDCAGVPFGPAKVDLCGVCNGTNKCVDCNGVPWGTAVQDRCGVCNGDGQSCLQCVDIDISGAKVKINGDEFVKALKQQSDLLLKESHPYPPIRVIESSCERRNNRAKKWNQRLRDAVASLDDIIKNCANKQFCHDFDNLPAIRTMQRCINQLRRQVGRTIRERNIDTKTMNSLLNKNTKLYNEKYEVINSIPRASSVCD